MKKQAHLIMALSVLALGGVSAEARRTVIDQTSGMTVIKELGGYCDLDGLDCNPINLNYEVDFGSGFRSQVIVYGNGLISFGADPIPLDMAALSETLTGYDGIVVSGGLNPFTTRDQASGDQRFEYVASLEVLSGGVIAARFEDCATPQFCFTPNTLLTLTPAQGGYNAAFSNRLGNVAGFAIPGGASLEIPETAGSFFIPGQFRGLDLASAVPEPTTWAMMLVGFGGVGYSVRRSSRKRTALAAA